MYNHLTVCQQKSDNECESLTPRHKITRGALTTSDS